ncbi:MAG: DUF1611 domain-containing protein [Candidatus Thermoplasmatota archaeon]|nr:DUF1611 domain-containing protein [Candidatus Thermoplasmatota archaeon]MCL5889071.1 DUF1611 domain-containing protein [Candidatus Thermoplasmatota archaeon]
MDKAVILAEGFLGSTYGKTANGLCRFSKRYDILSVIDSKYAGMNIQEMVPGARSGIKIISSVEEAAKMGANTLIVGVATDGGFLPEHLRAYVADGIKEKMSIVSGLHQFISDDPDFMKLSKQYGSEITDVRKMFMMRRDFFTGKIWDVKSKKIAVLGTDSAIGKRTTAVYLNEEVKKLGKTSAMIGTGQTAWMQGFPYTVVIDSMVNDFVAGGIESAIVEAWEKEKPDYMFLEGQGSVLHPAYPGSFEIIAAGKPDGIILQHAPTRVDYDGFPGIKIPPVERFIKILEELSDKKVIGIAINREGLTEREITEAKSELENKYGLPAFDPLVESGKMAEIIVSGL